MYIHLQYKITECVWIFLFLFVFAMFEAICRTFYVRKLDLLKILFMFSIGFCISKFAAASEIWNISLMDWAGLPAKLVLIDFKHLIKNRIFWNFPFNIQYHSLSSKIFFCFYDDRCSRMNSLIIELEEKYVAWIKPWYFLSKSIIL